MFIGIPLVLCLIGIGISLYIYTKKNRHSSLACSRDNPCDAVLESKYGTTCGIRNEIGGIFYFVSIALLLIGLTYTGLSYGMTLIWMLRAVLLCGGLFSVYLLSIQAFVLKSYCRWCLCASAVNILLIIVLLPLVLHS